MSNASMLPLYLWCTRFSDLYRHCGLYCVLSIGVLDVLAGC